MINAPGFLLRLLVDPRYRIYRHLLLFVFSMITIGLNYYMDLVERKNLTEDFAQSVFLLVPIYLSVFVLTPRFLLRNKIGTYILSVYLCIGLSLLFSFLLRNESIRQEYQIYQFWMGSFLIISSVIQLSLIIAGASAVIVFQDYIKNGQRIGQLENATIQSELEQLKNQINPHFLYNTLDIIVWMIENEKQADAVKVVTALARFFRISLSRGKSIIPVRDELEHVRNYLMIQHMRFKNRFTYEIEADEDVMELASVKLILQPLVENAVYHGMEFMDGDGEIRIRVYRDGEDLYMKVSDNGLGMTKEQVKGMFTDKPHVKSGSGSGIGVRNVNERIRLYFGQEYGLSIESELDEGTVVTIHMRAVPYAETAEGEKIHVK